jgi:hypothetical protein
MKIIEKIKATFSTNRLELNEDKKKNIAEILFLFVIYFLAILSIIRANFNYADDLRRTIDGAWGLDSIYSRHISKYLSYLIHADSHLTDISPLPQLVACLILAIAGFILVKTICNKTSKFLLIASLPIGLSPYFLECFSYKFDAPYMALSILASVFPFLFMQRKWWLFSLVCIASMLVMTMTYQAASGIFIMLTVYFFFTNLLYKQTTIKDNFIFLIISLVSYCIAILVFRQFFMQQVDGGYVSTYVASSENMITVFLRNVKRYFTMVYFGFNRIWKILSLTVIIIFYIKTIVLSKINKIYSFFLATLFLGFLLLSIFGLYLFLQAPLFLPRAMYAVGVFIAILCIDIGFSLKKIFSAPSMVLIWCFFVFNFAYGNALAAQNSYNTFRTEMLLHDLASLLPEKTDQFYQIKIINNEGYSPVVENAAVNNPMIKGLVLRNLGGGWVWGYVYLSRYHKFKLRMNESIIDEDMPVIFDSYYHTIKHSENQIMVVLK